MERIFMCSVTSSFSHSFAAITTQFSSSLLILQQRTSTSRDHFVLTMCFQFMSFDFTTRILSDNQRSTIPILFYLDFLRVNYSTKYSIYMYVYIVYILSISSWLIFLESKLHQVHWQEYILMNQSCMYKCINANFD